MIIYSLSKYAVDDDVVEPLDSSDEVALLLLLLPDEVADDAAWTVPGRLGRDWWEPLLLLLLYCLFWAATDGAWQSRASAAHANAMVVPRFME